MSDNMKAVYDALRESQIAEQVGHGLFVLSTAVEFWLSRHEDDHQDVKSLLSALEAAGCIALAVIENAERKGG